MDSPIEYLFNGALRWSFGFDNPNKAAVLFACALPVVWIFWDWAWQKRRLVARALAAVVALLTFAPCASRSPAAASSPR